jgi:hypothetical protein
MWNVCLKWVTAAILEGEACAKGRILKGKTFWDFFFGRLLLKCLILCDEAGMRSKSLSVPFTETKKKVYTVIHNSILHHTTTCFDPLPKSSSGRSTPRSKNVYNCKKQNNYSLQ